MATGKPMDMTKRLNNLITGVRDEKDQIVSGAKSFVSRVKKNINEDQEGLKKGTVGRYQYTNPLRK